MFKFIVSKNNLLILTIIAFTLGSLFGFVLPELSLGLTFLSTIFLNSIKLMIVPLIFCSIFLGILENEHEGTGKMFLISLLTFLGLFTTTLFISLPIAFLMNPGQNFTMPQLSESELAKLATTSPNFNEVVSKLIPTNMLASFVEGDILQVVMITIIISLALLKYRNQAKPLIQGVQALSLAIFKIIEVIMIFSPLAVFSLMANTTAKYGFKVLISLSEYIGAVFTISAIALLILIVIPIKFLTEFSFGKILKSLLRIWVIALATTSSAATLPTTFSVVEDDLEVNRDRARFILPLSTTLNMIGGAISCSVLSVFTINIYGGELTLILLAKIIFFAIVLNMAAPGIPGGGIALGTAFLVAIGYPADVMVLIAAIYRIVDMAFTTLNVSGDVIAAILIDKYYNYKESRGGV